MNMFHLSLIRKLTSILILAILGNTASAQFNFPEVPEEVRGERPSQEEVQRARALLDEFKAGLSGADRDLLERHPSLIELKPPFFFNSAVVPGLLGMFEEKHRNNVARAQQGNVDVLFMGDSITDFWRNEAGPFAGKGVMDATWPDLNIANFGIAGDTTQGVLYRLANGEGEGFTPKAIMLMIGTNNTYANSGLEIAEAIGAIVQDMQTRWPDAEILLLGIFPRSTPDDPVREEIARINNTISRLDTREKVHYLDIGNAFLDENGFIPEDVMSDLLHPSTKGYELWAEAVKEPLAELLR